MFNFSYTAAICQSELFLFVCLLIIIMMYIWSIFSYIECCGTFTKQVRSSYRSPYRSYKHFFPPYHPLWVFPLELRKNKCSLSFYWESRKPSVLKTLPCQTTFTSECYEAPTLSKTLTERLLTENFTISTNTSTIHVPVYVVTIELITYHNECIHINLCFALQPELISELLL